MYGEALASSPLDRRLTFASFLVGRSNQLAYSAAQRVVEDRAGQAPAFSPLYVHSAVGLGKTHLLQATAHAAAAQGRSVIYLTAERFMYGFVAALQSHTAIAFKEAMRSIDLLIIDDVQFLQGKAFQNEFGHALNALLDSGRQVVVAADRPPADLEALDERVRSRLAGGLCVEMTALDEPLRMKILEARIAAARAQNPQFAVSAAVVAYVARSIVSNGRDLEGAVNRLIAHSIVGSPLTVEAAEAAIRDLVRAREPRRVKIEDIQKLVASHYSVSRSDILSARRTATVVKPRQVAMYLSKALTLALAAGDRPPLRRTRPHDRAACGAQDRGPQRHRHRIARRARIAETDAAGLAARDGADLQDRRRRSVARRDGGGRLLRRRGRSARTATSISRPPPRRPRRRRNGSPAAPTSCWSRSRPTRWGRLCAGSRRAAARSFLISTARCRSPPSSGRDRCRSRRTAAMTSESSRADQGAGRA